MTIRLVENADPSHVLQASVVKKRLHVVTLKRVVRRSGPFRPEVSWSRRFDTRTGRDLDDHGAFHIHPDHLAHV